MVRTIATLALALGLLATSASAQTASLTTPPPLAKGMAGLPRIAAPITPATTRINAALAKVDANWTAMIKDCRQQAGKDFDMERTVDVAMRGPGYVSVAITYEYDCGGAHPDSGVIALTYSLETGAPANWARLLPKSLVDSASTDTAGDGTTVGLIASKALQKIYAREALAGRKGEDRKDCADVFSQDGLTFQVWPDAKASALMLAPNLPHVVAACGDPQPISARTLQSLGVAAPLLSAIAAAHAETH